MPIGLGTFSPGGRFSINRAYVKGIAFNISGYVVTQAGNMYNWTKISDPDEVWTIIVDNRFWLWSSNTWTLDHILTDFYYTLAPSTVPNPQPYSLIYGTVASTIPAYLQVRFSTVDFGVYHYFPFAAAPSSYWLPEFPAG